MADDLNLVVGYLRGMPCTVDLIDIGGGHELHRPAGLAFRAMRQAAFRDGLVLVVNTAFRTMARQQELHRVYKAAKAMGGRPSLVAEPGWSTHQAGCSVDLNRAHDDKTDNGIADGKTDKWLAAHAGQYGFVRDVRSEPWHWTHTGSAEALKKTLPIRANR